jgi:hypothetical protein
MRPVPRAPCRCPSPYAAALFAALWLALLTLAPSSWAQPRPPDAAAHDPRNREEGDPSYDGPVLPPGRETAVVALLRPYAPGGPLGEGWSFGNVSIRRDHIAAELKRDGAVRGHLLLLHPSARTPDARLTANLAVRFAPPDVATNALRESLFRAVQANDRRSLWAAAQGTGDVVSPRGVLGRWALDGALLGALLVVFLGAAVRRHTREGPRWLLPAVLGVTAAGFALRLLLAREAPMNAWPYSRVVPLAGALYNGPMLAWLSRALHVDITLVGTIFKTDLALAALTPAALFVHARAGLKDLRAALAALLLMATLPAHIRFSRSDVEFLQSLLLSSLTFTALYGALGDERPRWRQACAVALPGLCLGTYLTRPENLVFYALDLAACAVAAAGTALPWRRVAAVGALVSVPAGIAAWGQLLARYRAELSEGLSTRTLRTAWETLRSTQHNTLINPAVTPPWVLALAALGLYALLRAGERRRAAFLVGWLAVFFVVHSYVRPHEVAMQARYHLHLATPLVLLAASAAPLLADRARAALAPLALLLLATPWIYRGFIQDTAFYEMREFAFVRRAAARVPWSCRVLEFRGVPDPTHPAHHFDSRWQRFANRVASGVPRVGIAVITADEATPGLTRGATERLSPAARAALDGPPGCVMVYLGLSCVAQRPEGMAESPVCTSLRTWGTLRPVAEETITGRVYDSMNIGHPTDRRARVWGTLDLLPPNTPVRLGLYRYLRHPTDH